MYRGVAYPNVSEKSLQWVQLLQYAFLPRRVLKAASSEFIQIKVALVPCRSIYFKKLILLTATFREIVLRMAERLAVFPLLCSLAAVSVGAMQGRADRTSAVRAPHSQLTLLVRFHYSCSVVEFVSYCSQFIPPPFLLVIQQVVQ